MTAPRTRHLGFHHRTRKRLARCHHPTQNINRARFYEYAYGSTRMYELFTCTACGAWVQIDHTLTSSTVYPPHTTLADIRDRMPSRILRKRAGESPT